VSYYCICVKRKRLNKQKRIIDPEALKPLLPMPGQGPVQAYSEAPINGLGTPLNIPVPPGSPQQAQLQPMVPGAPGMMPTPMPMVPPGLPGIPPELLPGASPQITTTEEEEEEVDYFESDNVFLPDAEPAEPIDTIEVDEKAGVIRFSDLATIKMDYALEVSEQSEKLEELQEPEEINDLDTSPGEETSESEDSVGDEDGDQNSTKDEKKVNDEK
jgi:hypothetical protein